MKFAAWISFQIKMSSNQENDEDFNCYPVEYSNIYHNMNLTSNQPGWHTGRRQVSRFAA